MSAVKETHYWDTATPEARAAQIAQFEAQLSAFEVERADAEAELKGWKVRNMTRRIEDMTRLIAMLRDGSQAAYLRYLTAHADDQTRLIGDICPSYGLLDETEFARMAAVGGEARFLYLVREPVARLWSAVRMQAERQATADEDVEEKANNTLWRVIHRGAEAHLTARGDYAATVARLRAAVPEARLKVMYMEELVTDAGYGALCAWLGLPMAAAPVAEKVHAGRSMPMRPHLAQEAAELLSPQYAFAAAEIGPLPEAWAARA